MNDILLTANAMLTLKYLIFCDHGLKFHKLHILWQLDNFYYDHPDIKILDTTNDDTLVIMGREAVNTITALHHKYPY